MTPTLKQTSESVKKTFTSAAASQITKKNLRKSGRVESPHSIVAREFVLAKIVIRRGLSHPQHISV